MELKNIYECQELLSASKIITTKEERECDKLLRNKDTLDWLTERKNSYDKEIKELEGKILEKEAVKGNIGHKQTEQENLGIKLKELENQVNNLEDTGNENRSKAELTSKISEVANKIKEYEYDIGTKQEAKNEADANLKNKDDNMRHWEVKFNSAVSELNSANTELTTSQQRGSHNSCWGGRSPELNNACVNQYRNKVQEKNKMKNEYENNYNSAKSDLKTAQDKSSKLSEEITSLNNKKNDEISKKNEYLKEQQELESKITSILGSKISLESEINNEKTYQNKINEELANLILSEESMDTNGYENQKTEFEKEVSGLKMAIYTVIKYQNTEMVHEQIQQFQQEL